MHMKKSDIKIALVTGASSGIGRAAARLMAKNGYIVYGTSRSAKYETAEFEGASYTMIPLTLEDERSVKKAIDFVIERQGCIDIVVNAAGRGIAGAIEETTAEEAAEQFDVCFFGIMRVLNHVLPHMRAQKSGMIINIGSLSSCFPVPFQAMYSASKAALFSMTTLLRLEMKPFGVKACTVEPGNTVSGFIASRRYAKKTCDTAYRKPLERALCVINSEKAAYSPETSAKSVLRAARMKNPPVRVTPGFAYKLFYGLSKLTSWKMKERAIRAVYLKKDPQPGAIWTFDKQFREK
jgi:short-subunit dehydrogenase